MMSSRYIVIKSNYVVNIVEWDAELNPDWTYPHPHDQLVPDTSECVGIGDWYEESEGIFYRPINGTPLDLPEELQ